MRELQLFDTPPATAEPRPRQRSDNTPTPIHPDGQVSAFDETLRRELGIKPKEVRVGGRNVFPLKTLVDLYASRLHPDDVDHAALWFSELVGVSDAHVRRMLDDDTNLDGSRADEWAMRLGFHPSAVWANWGAPGGYAEIEYGVTQ